jgi:signal transduction histidine kinase/ActR/RegA family two-component response regulator
VPVGPWNTDGLIVINPLVSEEALEDVRRFRADGHPVVFLNDGQEGPTVSPDNAVGIEQAVAHLAAHGHRRIAYAYCMTGDGPERRAAYEAAVRRHGLDLDPALQFDGRHWKDGGREAVEHWLREGVELTAVLASNDASARGALLRLQELGKRVPEDVAVVGFDDMLEAIATDPAMTSIHAPIDESARTALELLLAQIRGEAVAPLTVMPSRLVVRGSCGCAPDKHARMDESTRRAMASQLVHDSEIGRSISTFTGSLLAAPRLDMLELGRILQETLPGVGIGQCLVGAYEADGDDPLAWSVVRRSDGGEPLRFPTRSFPGPEFADGEPFQMIVVPLRLQDELGFLAMSAENLSSCLAIALHSEGAFESASNLRAREQVEAALVVSEEQLRQAQKMEAVGQLAGGLAHDFNNLLTAVLGHSELMLARLGPDHDLRGEIEMVVSAAERASALTQQLLAFSRRQIMQPTVVELNAVVERAHALLDRVLGDDIELRLDLREEAGCVRVDRSQLDQVIVNLALNARDAMPAGGTLELTTARVSLPDRGPRGGLPPGDYATLQVRDSGIGMSEETRSHMFEPFFTTKEVGKGTGLGLATVHGIVKQSGGDIVVESHEGRGSTFTVYLPGVEAGAAGAAEAPRLTLLKGPHDARAGTILLVEDDTAVRAFVRATLEVRGYNVLEAMDPAAALQVSHRHRGPVDALLTDVVMPGMNGRELAAQLLRERPGLRILFMSGYAAESIFDQYEIAPTTPFLSKPFSAQALLDKLESALGTPDGSGRPLRALL